ncbi:MAG: hypothetical protein R3270_10650 [Gammaproteobacteria bacterium]|nr:hypothetical protein [Gammaproteobacteria bacterium]
MELTLLLSKVLGLLLIITSLSFIIRRRYYEKVLEEFVQARALRMLMSIIELTAGLFLVILHNDWSSLAAAIITAVGWMAIIESTAYLFMPDRAFARLIGAFNQPSWYIGGGLIGLLAGGYLVLVGFGFIG